MLPICWVAKLTHRLPLCIHQSSRWQSESIFQQTAQPWRWRWSSATQTYHSFQSSSFYEDYFWATGWRLHVMEVMYLPLWWRICVWNIQNIQMRRIKWILLQESLWEDFFGSFCALFLPRLHVSIKICSAVTANESNLTGAGIFLRRIKLFRVAVQVFWRSILLKM